MRSEGPTRYVISVLVGDRVGILRDITSAVTDMGANIDGISQTVVEGYFTVILTATFPGPAAPDTICQTLCRNFAEGEASIVARPHALRSPAPKPADGQRYICTFTGKDRKGILKTVTAFLAAKRINIEDWYVQFDDARVIHLGEITVPAGLDIQQVQDEFRQVLQGLELRGSMQHENIFTVTNEVGAIEALIRRQPHAQDR